MALTSLGAATLNYQLTNFAQGLMNDLKDSLKLAERLAPSTPVPGAAGQYKKFDDKNSFLPVKTARALGADPVRLKFNATDDFYSCQPQALDIAVDKEESQAVGDAAGELGQDLLDQGKIQQLLNTATLSHTKDVCDYVLANTTADTSAKAGGASAGAWSNPDIDPLDQLNYQLLAISQDCGTTQGIQITMDISSWNALRNHPKVKANAIFGAGSAIARINPDNLNAALLFPCDIMPANVVYDTTALDQTSSKSRLLSGVCLVHYTRPNAGLYDPSAFKAFTVGTSGFVGNVRTWQHPSELYRVHLIDWSRDIRKTSTLSVRRLNIS